MKRVSKIITRRDLFWISICALIFLLYIDISIKNKKKHKDYIELTKRVDNWRENFSTTKNKYNQEVAKNKVLLSNNRHQFLSIISKDSAIIKLQKEVKRLKLKTGDNTTYIETKTTIPIIKTNIKRDTIKKVLKDTIYIVSNDVFEFNNKWVSFNGFILNDSLSILDLSVYNESLISVYEKRLNWFKTETVVELVQLNPFTTTESLVTYKVDKKPQKRLGLGLSTGVLYSLDKNKIVPYFGLGLNYNIIEIR